MKSKSATTLRFWSIILKYGVPLAVSVGLCWLLFSGNGIDAKRMWQTVKADCDFRWIAANIAFGLVAQVVRAYRWRIQLKALSICPPVWEIVLSIFGTYSVNLVLPRLGEVWRTGFIASRTRSPFATVFGSMVADRLADTITVALMLFALFIPAGARLSAYMQESGGAAASLINILKSPTVIIICLIVILIIAAIFLFFPEHKAVRKIRSLFKELWKGFSVIVTMPGKGLWLILTLCIWSCYFLSFYCAMQSFPVTTHLVEVYGMVSVAVIFVLSSISMGVPSNGGIGPWQWAVMFGLLLYAQGIAGLTREYALTFANLVMGVQTLVLIVQGLLTFICIAFLKHSDKLSSQSNLANEI